MTFFSFRSPTPWGLALITLAAGACRETTAPSIETGAALGTPSVGSAVLLKSKKSVPVIQSFQLSTTSLELNNGIAATYNVTINNPIARTSRTYADAYLQGEIRQGGVVAATGGGGVRCSGGPNAVLPLGICIVNGATISTIPGAGSLVAGAATFALTLYSQSGAFDAVTVTTPVVLGPALVTP